MPSVIIDQINDAPQTFICGHFYKIKHYETSVSRTEIFTEGMFVGLNKKTDGTMIVMLTFKASDADTLSAVYIPAGDVTNVEDTTNATPAVNDNLTFTAGIAFVLDCTYTA